MRRPVRAPDAEEETSDDAQLESGKRVKKASDHVTLLVAQFRGRAKGLSGAELDAEVERLVDQIIEANVKVMPEALRDEARELLKSRMEDDPTLLAMLEDLKAGARKGG